MAKLDVKVFNLLIHYGKGFSHNLADLLEDCFFEILKEGQRDEGKHHASFPVDVKLLEEKGIIYISGFFHKTSTLKWNFVPDGDRNPKMEPGQQDVIPRARFIIDTLNHRLFWITEVGETHAPTAKTWLHYLKKVCIPVLQDIYLEKEFGEEKVSKNKKKTFLEENHLTARLLIANLVPIVTQESLSKYFKGPHFKISSIKITPHLPNPTNEEFKSLFVNTGKLAAKAEAKSKVELTALDRSKGMQKAVIEDVLTKNQNAQLLTVEMRINDSRNPNDPPIKVSNRAGDGGQTDISLRTQFSADIEADLVLDKTLDYLEKFKNLTTLPKEAKKLKDRLVRILKNGR